MEDEIVIKDRNEDYNKSISKMLDEIDMFKQTMLSDPSLINRLKERLDALSTRLWGKMNSKERNLQRKIRIKISKMNPFYSKKTIDEFGDLVNVTRLDRKKFIILKNILERKEISLNIILERIGLTAKPEKKKKKVF